MIRRNILLFLALLTSVLAGAQNINIDSLRVMDYSSPKEYEIAEITITGVEFLQKDALISFTGLAVGEKITVPGDVVTKVVKKLWDHGLFSDVKLYATKIEGGKIWLNIYLKERPRMSGFVIHGVNKSESDDLKEKLDVRVGSQVTDDLLNTITRLVKDHFVEKGFLNTTVKIDVKQDSVRENMVKLKC